MAIRWEAEALDLGYDPASGALIRRLTASVMTNLNIYYEQPHCSPDGSRIAYLRSPHSDPRKWKSQICVADLAISKVCLCDTDVVSDWVATSSWSGQMHYLRSNGELIRLDITTLEKQIVLTHWPLPKEARIWSVTPDMRYLVAVLHDLEYMCNVVLVDLKTGKYEVIYRHPEFHGHVQINHVNGQEILLQRYGGKRKNLHGDVQRAETDREGASHLIINLDGSNERLLNIGEPYSAPSTGHASWVSDTGRIATPVGSLDGIPVGVPADQIKVTHDARHPQGNMLYVGPNDDKPLTHPASEHLFDHASMSKCGRYFVADCFCHGLPGPVEIVIGNLQTGKTRVLVSDCGAQGGGPACSHPHPYFTADSKRVIYNADPHNICHIHMAIVPDGFLESLD